MSAAANAAGYLFATGQLRGRGRRGAEDSPEQRIPKAAIKDQSRRVAQNEKREPAIEVFQERRQPKIIIKQRKHHIAP